MPNPWTIIGWLLLVAIVLALVVVLFLAVEAAQPKAPAASIVRTADVPPNAREAAAGAPS
jgi:hypothetical protein